MRQAAAVVEKEECRYSAGQNSMALTKAPPLPRQLPAAGVLYAVAAVGQSTTTTKGLPVTLWLTVVPAASAQGTGGYVVRGALDARVRDPLRIQPGMPVAPPTTTINPTIPQNRTQFGGRFILSNVYFCQSMDNTSNPMRQPLHPQ